MSGNLERAKVLPEPSEFIEDLDGFRLPINNLNSHFLNQVSDAAYYHRDNRHLPPSTSGTQQPNHRPRLHVCVSLVDIKTIDFIHETFSCKLRLYAMWEEDLSQVASLSTILERAKQSEEYTLLSASEIEVFEKLHFGAPLGLMLSVFNTVTCEHDEQSLRLYSGVPGRTALMWNREYRVECRNRFDLHNFPFDSQTLPIELRLNDPRSWDKFDLQVIAVQFQREALKLTEWAMLTPGVCRESPASRVTRVTLRVTRLPYFYIVNVVGIMSGLTVLGLLCYAMPVDDIGSRINTVLTIILTSVAFKFVLAGSLPRVPYNTLVDYFVLLSMMTQALTAFMSVIPNYVSTVYPGADEWKANYVCAAISVGFLTLTLGGWGLRAFYVIQSRVDKNQVQPMKDVNWYYFPFYNLPHFLQRRVTSH